MSGVRVTPKAATQLTLIGLAVLVAVFPPGTFAIERWYARGLYPQLQAVTTSVSNRVPVALFDVAMIILAIIAIVMWAHSVRVARRKRSIRPIGRGFAATLTLAALVYLWFLTAWGLNYARQPIESVMTYDASRVTPQAARALAEYAIAQANRTHAAAHAAGFPGIDEMPRPLVTALQDVERELGRPRTTVVARPKTSIFSPFFRASSVSGMLAPLFLETLLNPDLTGPERPSVLAHEWAHLSGYAPEDDASFVGLLAALRAGPAAEYSAWLELAFTAVSQLQPVTQKLVLENLAEGPRIDQRAIYQRVMANRIETVDRAAWATYDQLLRSQGVEEGVQSYSRVVELLLGTNVLKIDQDATPKPQDPSPKTQDPSPKPQAPSPKPQAPSP
jgi:hypothetical protein